MKDKVYKRCVIDADYIPYRAAAAAEKVEYDILNSSGEIVGHASNKKEALEVQEEFGDFYGEDTTDWKIEPVKQDFGLAFAKKIAANLFKKIKSRVKAKEYTLVFTGNDNMRRDLATIKKYKGNRDNIERPKYLGDVRDFMMNRYEHILSEGIEADDIVSVIMYSDFEKNGEDSDVCAVIIDKDLNGTPGTHFHALDEKFYFVDEFEADRWMFIQSLCGDGTDNIQGVPDISKELKKSYGLRAYKGVGEKTATAIIDSCANKYEMYETVLKCYIDHYGSGALYKDHRGDTLFRTAIEIADENLELIFMERKRGQRWSTYKENYYRDVNEQECD